MSTKKVLSVGQCSADHSSIAYMMKRHFDAEVVAAHSFEDAEYRLRRGGINLVLVNRVFNNNGASGVDFIAEIKGNADLPQVPVMLVSNYPDAQEQAVALGALPGFGKAAIGEADTIERLRDVLG